MENRLNKRNTVQSNGGGNGSGVSKTQYDARKDPAMKFYNDIVRLSRNR